VQAGNSALSFGPRSARDRGTVAAPFCRATPSQLMKKFFVAPAFAALAVFIFGAIYWMSPLPYQALSRVSDDAAAGASLAKIFPGTGTYFVPGMYLEPAQHETLAKRGPIAEVHFQREGMDLYQPVVMLKGYLHSFVVSLLLVFFLECSGATFESWLSRAKMCMRAGLLVALWHYADAIWWHHSLAWETMRALYAVLAFAVIGLVLGKMLTPKQVAVPAPIRAAAETTV